MVFNVVTQDYTSKLLQRDQFHSIANQLSALTVSIRNVYCPQLDYCILINKSMYLYYAYLLK